MAQGGNPKSECRNPSEKCADFYLFGIRVSFGFRDSDFGVFTASPHRPAPEISPLLRTAINLHLPDFFPGDGTIEKTEVASRCADRRSRGAARVWVGGVKTFQARSIPAVRREGLAVTGRPI